MYDFISGKLFYKENTFVVIESNGIGYEIRISPQTASVLPVPPAFCQLFTYLHVKEDALTLYGFLNRDEKNLFLLLISVSGVGPSTALVILATLSVSEIKEAIASENIKVIQMVKGIGLKTAQRLVLELKDKIQKQNWTEAALQNKASVQQSAGAEEALEALVKLGFARPVAEKSLKAVLKLYGNDLSVSDMIRYALKQS